MKERRRKNCIDSLPPPYGTVNSEEGVKEEVRRLFSDEFVETDFDKPTLDGINFNSMTVVDKELLEASFLDVEIKEVVWSFEGSNSSGPNKYNFFFIRKCWKFLKKDFYKFFNDFHGGSDVFFKATISSFLTLIPKKYNPSNLDDYRIIFLVGCLYKALTKLLGIRLKYVVLAKLVSHCQSAFVLGRHLLDDVLVANAEVDFALKEKKSYLLYKVDFKKSYDKVSCYYLKYVLVRIGFRDK
ncbi:uncharacterized protein LOC131605139 [Vicia villosa]|uniref:uncharacterized protein LOC131605139 n=1 Tax=Vicia villosa TaxID=3911 RepID=UPI00273B91E5|nr:uncharacterized protein LOC131605139 [Vicia villosa]